jgi:hypothetical protein
MTIARDAGTASAAATTDPLTWTHTPVGTPRGVVVLIASLAATDDVVGVTYGGVAMAEVTAVSPRLVTAGAEDGSLYVYFLGTGIPTGAQTVSVDMNGTGSTRRGTSITYTAAADTAIDATASLDSAGVANPSVDITQQAETVAIAAILWSGQNAVGGATEAGGLSVEMTNDFGNQIARVATKMSTAGVGAVVSVGWTATSEEAGIIAVAIREKLVTGAAALTGTGSVSGAALTVRRAASSLTGTGAVAAAARRVTMGAAALTGTGALSAAATVAKTVAASLTGTGAVSASARRTTHASASLTGTGSVSASALRTALVASSLAGSGALAASAARIAIVSSSLSGVGSIAVAADVIPGGGATTHLAAASLTGTGALSASAYVTRLASSNLAGAGALAASAVRVAQVAAALAGTGTLAGAARRVTFASAELTGRGSLTVAATIPAAEEIGCITLQVTDPHTLTLVVGGDTVDLEVVTVDDATVTVEDVDEALLVLADAGTMGLNVEDC